MSFTERCSARAAAALALAAALAGCYADESDLTLASSAAAVESGRPTLVARAILPAETYAPGPTSGARLGAAPINGVAVPFVDKQPVQGVSALHDAGDGDGTYWAMADNGFGRMENSADFRLRVYRLRADWKTAAGGRGEVRVVDWIELSDPWRKVPFAIANQFLPGRPLTGADFDIESLQIGDDGSLWFGDELGPFLIHTDGRGRVLEAPYRVRLPGAAGAPEIEVRSPQNPFYEEASAVRIMNAIAADARQHGGTRAPVFSPWEVLLDDHDPATFVDHRAAPPAGSGLTAASSELFDVASLHAAGYPVVVWTVNDAARMQALLRLGVDGVISDRPDLLYQAVASYDANGDGAAGDLLDADGLIDATKVDAQGHRGGRNLRPENTLPAFEVALDHLMTTLELDVGLTRDLVPVIDHDPHVQAQKCRRADGAPYEPTAETLVKDLTWRQLRAGFVCDRTFRGPTQLNELALSPVAVAFAASRRDLPHPYAMPSLDQLFDFVDFYVAYYRTGPGKAQPDAARRARNAARVRFNIETKINPRSDRAAFTYGPAVFALTVALHIAGHDLVDRADVQSFDLRTLVWLHRWAPQIRTVCLFGDFPAFADPAIEGSDDGTNLQPEGTNTPWLAGMPWPYRDTHLTTPVRAQRSGGFEGMARTPSGVLLPLFELPITGDAPNDRELLAFDPRTGRFSLRAIYTLDPGAVSIGDFVAIDEQRGLIIERDGSQGTLDGIKRIYEVAFGARGARATKQLAVDLLDIADPAGISLPGQPGDVGLGERFAFPFQTIEGVFLLDDRRVVVSNDNNFPFDVGRHQGTGRPADDELIVVDLGRSLAAGAE